MGGAEARAPWCFFVVRTTLGGSIYSEDLCYLKGPPFPGRSPTLVLLFRGSGLLLGVLLFAEHEERAGEMHRNGKSGAPRGAPPPALSS
jgi:hypothetical protein